MCRNAELYLGHIVLEMPVSNPRDVEQAVGYVSLKFWRDTYLVVVSIWDCMRSPIWSSGREGLRGDL